VSDSLAQDYGLVQIEYRVGPEEDQGNNRNEERPLNSSAANEAADVLATAQATHVAVPLTRRNRAPPSFSS